MKPGGWSAPRRPTARGTRPTGPCYPLKRRPRRPRTRARRSLYRGLTSLWGRQIPYTIMKFTAFERTVQLLDA